jgi:hypothetical protein
MSKCWNCNKEITLAAEEIKCDNCGEIVNFKCHNCNEWFSIDKTKLCLTCGFYICPFCNTCGFNCQKDYWIVKLKEIIPTITIAQLQNIADLIEEIKIGKDRRVCPRGVSISYAKSRIKRCVVKLKGYRVKNSLDLNKFKQRFIEITDKNLGEKLTINQSREAGSYGQEYRDVFNYCICEGKLKPVIVKKEGIEYEAFERCETSTCEMLDLKKLIIKVCTNPKCTIKEFPLSQNECCYCRYQRGKNIGKFFPLQLKISNKDICQLSRGDFKKDGKDRY